MMDCKNALTETDGDMEAAVDWLRTKGLAKAAKKAGRVAAEGLIGVAVDGNKARVGRSQFGDRFRRAQRAVPGAGREGRRSGAWHRRRRSDALQAAKFPGTGRTVDEEIQEAIATIGENITLRRAAKLSVAEGVVASYVHNQVAPRPRHDRRARRR